LGRSRILRDPFGAFALTARRGSLFASPPAPAVSLAVSLAFAAKLSGAASAGRWASDKRAKDGERAARGRTAPSPRRAAHRHAWQAPA